MTNSNPSIEPLLTATTPKHSDKPLIAAILLLLLAYGIAVGMGWMVQPAAHAHEPVGVHDISHTAAVLPFAMLLGAIAVFPLVGFTAHWWHLNHNKLIVATLLALITLAYFAFGHPHGGFGRAVSTLTHTIVHEYIPFIVLLFSLYTICGGIRISGDLVARPSTNTIFMAIGGLMASFVGTTGAAMLLVRPLLETNSERRHVAHTMVFFIFIVCNCGGLLLPIGDPPLFLGYLQGVDFLWTFKLWPSWLFVNGMLLAAYFVLDHFFLYPAEDKPDIVRDTTQVRKLSLQGIWPNAPLLLGVVLAVALLDSSKTIPGTDWKPWFYLREAVQIGLVALSLILGKRAIRTANSFDYVAIIEVACLFVGIFICMQPALEILNARGGELGINTPDRFFWGTGGLSSVLDNAPTYLVFFEVAKSVPSDGPQMAGVAENLLAAISLGAVMMGAMTYIGNGPNFMVKAIAEQAGVRMPSFFGYIGYSCVILLPILVLNAYLFVN